MIPRYEDLEPIMDARVEDHLGDSISYSRNGEAPVIIRGFINLFTDDGAIEGADPIRRRWTVSINKAKLDRPLATDRLTHPKLGPLTYKPSTGTITGEGRDWVFGLQKA